MIGQCSGCSDTVSTCIISSWKAFQEFVTIFNDPAIQSKCKGNVFNKSVRQVLLYGSNTWPVVTKDAQQLVTADSGMVRWIFGVSLEDRINDNQFYQWHATLEPTEVPWTLDIYDDNALPKKTATMHNVDGRQPKGQPSKRLCGVIHVDMKLLNLNNEDTNNRAAWSRAIKPKKLKQHADALPIHLDSGFSTTHR